jgi:hypothetical protein
MGGGPEKSNGLTEIEIEISKFFIELSSQIQNGLSWLS